LQAKLHQLGFILGIKKLYLSKTREEVSFSPVIWFLSFDSCCNTDCSPCPWPTSPWLSFSTC